MNILAIALDPYDSTDRIRQITVRMTLAEVVYLTKTIGATSWADREETLRGGGAAGDAVYDCLTGSLLNRFYDDGVNDAVADLGGAS